MHPSRSASVGCPRKSSSGSPMARTARRRPKSRQQTRRNMAANLLCESCVRPRMRPRESACTSLQTAVPQCIATLSSVRTFCPPCLISCSHDRPCTQSFPPVSLRSLLSSSLRGTSSLRPMPPCSLSFAYRQRSTMYPT